MADDSQIKGPSEIEADRDIDEIARVQPPSIALGLHADTGFLVQPLPSASYHGIESQLEAVFTECIVENLAPIADIDGWGRGVIRSCGNGVPGIDAGALGGAQRGVSLGEKFAQ